MRTRSVSFWKNMSSANLIVALTTVARKSDAQALAEGIIRERLAACVQIDGPIQSIYHWNGGIVNDDEYRLSIKLPATGLEALQQWIQAQHPYDTPQWIVLQGSCSEAYGKWVGTMGSS